ncbi:MAG: endonuclease/exonuclease/phosphatase family protein [Sphingomonadales bacterium]|nr:MAG: endonuclease/exonuclease/phosphatase family protein [Sphingomonadales bacterium]
MRIARLLAAIAALLLAAGLPSVAGAQALRVMTFNVRLPIASDGPNAWPHRRALAARTVAAASPDIIGTQELFKEQGDYLVEQLPQYAWIGVGRRGGDGDEHMGLFYRRDRLQLLKSGNFWLSDTPEVPGSMTWGNIYPRLVTWGQFRTRGGRRFFVFNTHFPYRAEDDEARRKCAELLLRRIGSIAGKARVVLTGDFNTTPDSEVHRLLTAKLADAWLGNRRPAGPAETFHNFTGKADRRIDWILTRGFKVRRAETITAHEGGLYPSDHFPVIAELH